MQRRLIPTWLVFFCSWLSFMGLCSLNASAQNYIISRTYKDGQAADAGNVAKTTTQVQYMDGLGRPIQQVAVGQSPTGKDIIVHQAYDAYGREPKQFLPFTDAGSAGSFRSNASSLQNTFYGSNTLQFSPADNTRPYNETTFESSPLNRPLEQQAPGQSSYSYLAYGVNNNANALTTVKRYDFQEHTNLENTVVANGNYINGQLSFVKVTDENGKIAIEFKDKLGQVILKRAVVEGSTFADTYYVYDDLGQLRAVLQPMYQNESSTHKFAFLYRYDDRGRLTEKQVPGAESVEMRYDQYDRLVLSRDGNQRVRDTWSFTKYDALNRPIVTGEINNSVAPTPLQLLSNGHHETLTGAGEVKYSLTATLPSLSDESGVLNVTYYDNYTNWGALAYADQYSLTPHTALKGQTTGARSRMLNPDGSYGDFLISTIYYDDNYRPIQTIKQLFGFLGENDPVLRLSIQYKYAIATVIAKEREQQGTSSSVVSIEKEYGYDHADRLLWVKHQITRDGIAQPQVTLAATDYNELGQLNQKWLHSTDGAKFRRQTAYTYSIRGWQTAGHTLLKKQDQISAQTQFKYLLAYGQGGGTYTNGNISDMSWEDYDDTHNGGYSFSYDGLNRLLSTGSAGGTNEGGLGYDLNGNLNTLKRWQNGTLIDDLTYHYSQGNRLNGIVDHSSHAAGFKEASTGGMGSYAYDANGNLTQDLNKGIAVGNLQYNLLNLVRQITIDSSTLAYYYDASGQKHQLVYSNTADVTKSESTRYVGSIEWEGNHLKRIATGEGQYIYKTSSTGEYQYYLNDHLGNTRVVVSDSGKVLQRTDYYGFGLQIPLLPTTSDSLRLVNKYLYNGKELQPQTGLLDYGARQYDAAVGRWFGVDPLAEISRRFSPFTYGFDNPINVIDPDGMAGRKIKDIRGNEYEIGEEALVNVYTASEGEGNRGDDPPTKQEKEGYYPSGVMRAASQQNATIKPTEAKKFDANFTPEEKAGHEGIYIGAEIIVGETLLGFLKVGKVGQWIKSLLNLSTEGELLKNSLPVSTEGKLLGKISNGNISMSGNTLVDGKFDFVVMKNGQVLLGRKHTFLSGGADVMAAGELKIRGGNIVGMNNLSGHYVPGLNASSNYLNIFRKLGIDVSKTHLQIYNSNGQVIKHIAPR